jgi:hypothetical protein
MNMLSSKMAKQIYLQNMSKIKQSATEDKDISKKGDVPCDPGTEET